MGQRIQRGKDIGELMVIAHAAVLASAGHDVTILIQERAGTTLPPIEDTVLLTSGLWSRITSLSSGGGCRSRTHATLPRRLPFSKRMPYHSANPPSSRSRDRTWTDGFKVRRAADYTNRDRYCCRSEGVAV